MADEPVGGNEAGIEAAYWVVGSRVHGTYNTRGTAAVQDPRQRSALPYGCPEAALP
jgi:hypothetical protein